jgi:ABC-type transport system involved in Fe-S cluster assembly fused permease/ATPase subunit
MKNTNLPTGGTRTSEVGLVYKELLSNASGSIEVDRYSALRVRAVAGTTVTIDGMLSCTLIADEIIVLNVGRGTTTDTKETVTVVFSGAVYAQMGLEVDRTN